MGNESLCALAALIRHYRSQQIVKREICMQVPDTEANRKSCICDKGDCPTYNQNALSDTLFCAIGASPKIPRRVKCPVSYTHLRAHETDSYVVCRLLLEKKKKSKLKY